MIAARTLTLSACLLIACGAPTPEPPPGSTAAEKHFERIASGSLFSTHDETQLLRAHALSKELETTLQKFPGVHDARVHLSLADGTLLSHDRDAKSRAAVLIVPSGPAFLETDEIQRFAAAAVPTLVPELVTVVVAKETAAVCPTARIGPFEVAEESASHLKTTLSALLALAALLAGALIFAGLRLRGLSRRAARRA